MYMCICMLNYAASCLVFRESVKINRWNMSSPGLRKFPVCDHSGSC